MRQSPLPMPACATSRAAWPSSSSGAPGLGDPGSGRGDRLEGGENDGGGVELRRREKAENGLGRLLVQPCGMPMRLFGPRRDHLSCSHLADNTKKIPLVQRALTILFVG